ncbi:hypothetical protein GCM10011504_47080 [Siccirubricoccus deserti]|uniref:Uncharacterized protein n=1 Tax=Siccirubricoccus deserti TaxID=2013562 RepID=A0A9X0R272_9PROT|nr:hypothetical protein [Siccirubricoccus deserti]MBC4018211.1 hypothetical protein [Siccirubricoccus deserti]GGC63461.1 hypothetical protein GCM10011504_47080 [Siccirubricoccus deserti]
MPYGVTLPMVDAVVQAARSWRVLAKQAGHEDAIRLGYAPHVTLSQAGPSSAARIIGGRDLSLG